MWKVDRCRTELKEGKQQPVAGVPVRDVPVLKVGQWGSQERMYSQCNLDSGWMESQGSEAEAMFIWCLRVPGTVSPQVLVPVHSPESIVPDQAHLLAQASLKNIINPKMVSVLSWSSQTTMLFISNFLESLSRLEPASGKALRGYKGKI